MYVKSAFHTGNNTLQRNFCDIFLSHKLLFVVSPVRIASPICNRFRKLCGKIMISVSLTLGVDPFMA